MGKRGRKTPIGKKKGYHLKLDVSVVKALDEIAPLYGTDRTGLIERGIAYVFAETIGKMSELLENGGDVNA